MENINLTLSFPLQRQRISSISQRVHFRRRIESRLISWTSFLLAAKTSVSHNWCIKASLLNSALIVPSLQMQSQIVIDEFFQIYLEDLSLTIDIKIILVKSTSSSEKTFILSCCFCTCSCCSGSWSFLLLVETYMIASNSFHKPSSTTAAQTTCFLSHRYH